MKLDDQVKRVVVLAGHCSHALLPLNAVIALALPRTLTHCGHKANI